MAGPLADMVRAKYPGAYDDLSDAELEAAVSAKFPGAYDDLVTPKESALEPMEPVASHEPAQYESPLLGKPREGLDEPTLRRMDQRFGDGSGLITGPLKVAQQAPGWIAQGMKKLAPKLMRESLGAQVSVRKKFPTVDLDAVAIREKAVPGSAKSKAAIDDASKAANQGIGDAVRAADASGRAPISARTVVSGLRPLYEQAGKAKRPEQQQAILERVRKIRSELKGGLSHEGAQARKEILQQEGKAALNSPNPKDAAYGSQLANAERKALTGALRQTPEVEQALNRSQEMKALQQAMTNADVRTPVLRGALASAGGSTAGAAVGAMAGGPMGAILGAPAGAIITNASNRVLSSPTNVGRMAQMLGHAQPTNDKARLALIQALNALMSSHGQESR